MSGVHTAMTNTLDTPVEALERALPVRVRRYTLRRGSGGAGAYRGGDGIERELEVLEPVTRVARHRAAHERTVGTRRRRARRAGGELAAPVGDADAARRLPDKCTVQSRPATCCASSRPAAAAGARPLN